MFFVLENSTFIYCFSTSTVYNGILLTFDCSSRLRDFSDYNYRNPLESNCT